MFTTDGSTCLAICVKAFESSTGLGITSGVAPGASVLSLAAFTPELITVPITMPTDKVTSSSVKVSSFCMRNRSMTFMIPSFGIALLPQSLRLPFHDRHSTQDECRARRGASGKPLTPRNVRRDPRHHRFQHENQRR